jgi:PAS domain S-box-containing protein
VNSDHQSESSGPVPDSDLLRLIFESARDLAIFTIDPNGVTTSWNLGAERLLGYTSEEMIGHIADVIFPRRKAVQMPLTKKDVLPARKGAQRMTDGRCARTDHAFGRQDC